MSNKAPNWPEEPLTHRLNRCRLLLFDYAMLTARESERCRKRIIASIKELQKLLDEMDKSP